MNTASTALYAGLMSGTSLDGVDGVLMQFDDTGTYHLLGHHHQAFPASLKTELLALNQPGPDEVDRSHVAGNALARQYADCVMALLQQHPLRPGDVAAIGCHGQTIRHRPDLGYTVQIGNAALLAELCAITVVTDFRSRDLAAGGQGAPLVPAFHQAVFADAAAHRVIVNIGGISNLTYLAPGLAPQGFDCGPGNVLLDGWIQRHQGQDYDKGGTWAASGTLQMELLQAMLAHPYFQAPPPKSTGRDMFNMGWLEAYLKQPYTPVDVQATLLELSACAISNAIATHCGNAREVYLCGGGAYNGTLFSRLQARLPHCRIATTQALGITPECVESAAFAWLARQALLGRPGNVPEATGAAGPRILGAVYQA